MTLQNLEIIRRFEKFDSHFEREKYPRYLKVQSSK